MEVIIAKIIAWQAKIKNKGVAMKCIICGRRPARDSGYCTNCASQIEAEKRRKQADKPAKFLTYHGYVVGLFKNGRGTLEAKLLRRSPEGLPKRDTLDLNRYCEGFTRDKIKAFKRCVLQLANA